MRVPTGPGVPGGGFGVGFRRVVGGGETVFLWKNMGKGEGGGEWGWGGVGTGKGTGKSMRKLCRNDPFSKLPFRFGGSFFTYSWSFFAYSEVSLITVP